MAVASELTEYNIGVRQTYDADLQVDFASALDLTFTPYSSHGSSGDAFLRVFEWHNVPVANGTFTARGLDGRFYGPNHEERAASSSATRSRAPSSGALPLAALATGRQAPASALHLLRVGYRPP